MEIIPIETRIFREHESLFKFLKEHLPTLEAGDVVVVTSKIVALAQGKTAEIFEKVKIIKREGNPVIKTKWCYLAKKNGDWLPNVGIDESNARGRLILLPEDSYGVAVELRRSLIKHYRLKQLGVLITDTRSRPLRVGTTGLALAYAGFSGLKNYRGKEDLFGRKLRYTQSNLADALAAAAVVVMGESGERIPLALIRAAPIKYSDRLPNQKELLMDPSRDLYGPLFQKRSNRRRRGK